MVKLYAPQSCFLFFLNISGIFHWIFHTPSFPNFLLFCHISWIFLKYTIFQNFEKFCSFQHFRNIPYSQILKMFAVFQFLWNFPYFSNYIKNSVLRANLWFFEIFHIPKKSTFLMFCHFPEYSRNIPYSKKIYIFAVLPIFWCIPFFLFSYSIEYSVHWIFHIP